MQSVAIFSLCVVAVASYGYAPHPPPPAYGGYHHGMGQAHHHASKPSDVPASGQTMEVVQPVPSSSSSFPAPQIVRLHHEIRENVANNVQYETTNGIRAEDNTQILPGTPNPENPSELWNKIAKSGFYAYTSPEGKPVEIHWTADGVNGFRATGDAIPTSPPAPIA